MSTSTEREYSQEEPDEVLAAYLEAVEKGWVPDLVKLQQCYPHLAEPLARFFANQVREVL